MVLEALRTGLKEGETKDNEAMILLQYALHVLGLTSEQLVDEGNYGYISFLRYYVLLLMNNNIYSPTTKEAVAAFQLNNKLQSTGDADPSTLVLLLKQTRVANAEAAKNSSKKALERAGKEENEQSNNVIDNNFISEAGPPPVTSPMFTTPIKKLQKDNYTTPTAPSPIPRTPNSVFSPSTPAPSTPAPSTPTSYPSTPISPSSFGTPSRSRANIVPAKSVLEQLYLRTPQHVPMWVYCAEIHENTTLVIINQGLVCYPFLLFPV